MNRFLVYGNRVLYGVLAAAVAGFVAALGGGGPEAPAQVEPMQLPSFAVPDLLRRPLPAMPTRNVFDQDGKPWEPAPIAASGKEQKPAASVVAAAHGLIQLPGIEGVLTDTGFVSDGQTLPDGQLKRVILNGYVVAGAQGEHLVNFDVDREHAIDELLHPASVNPTDTSGAASGAASVPTAPAAPSPANALLQQLQRPRPNAPAAAPTQRPLPPGAAQAPGRGRPLLSSGGG